MSVRVAAVLVCAAWSGSAHADPVYRFAIPAGRLGAGVLLIGAQAQITIAVQDPDLAHRSARAVQGQFDAAEALRRLIAGLPAAVRRIDGRTYQIVRTSERARGAGRDMAATPSSDPTILVTGSKRGAALLDYPGSVRHVDGSEIGDSQEHLGSEALTNDLPILASTHLGPGRDKLFIRGIADSSFIGPTQTTVGQYLGDLRINYNAPDPDLALYDMRAVEVLEGPQGTLYGAGALGGIVRLEPEPPDPSRRALAFGGGGTLTAHGAAGGDAVAVANLPLLEGSAAMRVIGYAGLDSGYIDDPRRGARNVNRTFTRGGRGTLRFDVKGWTVDIAGIVQDINSRDGQYADRALPTLERNSQIAQPFDNDYSLGGLVIRRRLGDLSLVSATSLASHQLSSTYDATTTPTMPLRYTGDDAISVLSNETRLSRSALPGPNWVAGIELLQSIDRSSRALGPVTETVPVTGTRNLVQQASAYGELTMPVTGMLALTGGARASMTRLVGTPLDALPETEGSHRLQLSLLPSAGAVLRLSPRLSLYARYQEGYRPGGLSVQSGVTQRFEADSLATSELGFRLGDASDRFSLSMAASCAHWEDIQADLVDSTGLPFTDNIGSGRVLGLEAQARWRPIRPVSLEGALFLDNSRLNRPLPDYAGDKDGSLPDVPAITARGAVSYATRWSGRPVTLHGSLNYVGHSRLGVGPILDLRQGDYFDARAGIGVRLGHVLLTMDLDNLFDSRRNTFALGDPFGVTLGRQITPQRPRNIRLGFSTKL